MSEVMKIVLTAVVTAGFGVVVFVLGQLLQRLFIEPIQEFVKTKGKVASALTRHFSIGGSFCNDEGDVIRDDPEVLRNVSSELRTFAADLRAWQAIIPCYSIVAFILRLPSKNSLKEATIALHQWSSAIFTDYGTFEYMDKIDQTLKLKVLWYFGHSGEAIARTERKRQQERKLP